MKSPELLSAVALRQAWLRARDHHCRWASSGDPVLFTRDEETWDVSRETPLGFPLLPFPSRAIEADLPDELFEVLERYCQEVLRSNRYVALVSRRDPVRQIQINVLDSLPLGILLAKAADRREPSPSAEEILEQGEAKESTEQDSAPGELSFLLDAGSGSGCPGIPAILTWSAAGGDSGDVPRLVLVESVGKKAEFLAGLVESLGLSSALVIRQRLEDSSLPALLSEQGLGESGLLTSRGLAKVARTLKWSRTLKGRLAESVLIKGPESFHQEWQNEGRQWSRWGWQVERAIRFEFPERSQILLRLLPD